MQPRLVSPVTKIVLPALPAIVLAFAALGFAAPAMAAQEKDKPQPAGATYVEVTANRVPEAGDPVPAACTSDAG